MNPGYYLVTGAAGFIGSQLTEALVLRGKPVIALDSFLEELYPATVKKERWNRLESLDDEHLKCIKFDLRTDNFEVLEQFQIRSIFNQAALPGLISDPRKFSVYYDCNLSALNRLLEFAKDRGVHKFVQASTSSVYGRSAIGDEDSELKPVSPYGVSKLAAEKLLLAYKEAFEMPSVILRYFSVYGPAQRPDMAYSKLISAALNGREFHMYGDGLQRRSNTSIDDIFDATIRAEEMGNSGEIFNVCGDETISLLDAISEIESSLGVAIRLKKLANRTGDQRETSGSNYAIKSRLNWIARTNFKTGIQNQIAFAKKDPQFLKSSSVKN